MPILRVLCFSFVVGTGVLVAADVAPTPAPAQSMPTQPAVQLGGIQPMRMPQMGRPSMAYEVETLSLATSDAAAMGTWAELAAQGFHVVGCVAGAEGKQILFFERLAPMGGTDLRLPRIIEQDAGGASAVRARIQAALAERARAGRQGMPDGAMPRGFSAPPSTPAAVTVPAPAMPPATAPKP